MIDGEGHAPGALGLRDRAMLEVLYGAGLRVSECAGLDLDHLARSGADLTLRVVEGKGGKDRIVPLGSAGAAALRAWSAVRGALLAADAEMSVRTGSKGHTKRAGSGPVFLSRRGGRVSARSIPRAGISPLSGHRARTRVGPHGLRHSFATHLLRVGLRPAQHPAHARAREPVDDAALHPPRPRAPDRHLREGAPARPGAGQDLVIGYMLASSRTSARERFRSWSDARVRRGPASCAGTRRHRRRR